MEPKLREKMGVVEISLGMRKGDTLHSRVLTTLLIILISPKSPISLIIIQLLPQHPMSRRNSCIVVNIEILTYELFLIVDDFAYSTLCCVLGQFNFCHDFMCLCVT